MLSDAASAVLGEVAAHGPAPLAADARTLLDGGRSAVASLLIDYWRARSDRQFFAEGIVQPYAPRCAEAGAPRESQGPRSGGPFHFPPWRGAPPPSRV